jgi:Kdo2-lipid IVA lauroyltransferase/acyltransferase
MSPPLPKRIRRAVRSVIVRAVIRLLALVPRRPAFAFASLVGWAGWRLAGRTRSEMLASLEIAFPERTPSEREAIGRASFLHLARLAAEVATLPRWRDRFPEYVRFAPGAEERLRELHGRGKGIVFIGGHVGNWELLGQRVAAVVPSATIARAGNDPKLTAAIGAARASGNVETLWREDPATARAMIRCFKQGKLLGMLIDQDTNVQGVYVPFFGRPAWTPRGAADLALRFRAPVVVGWCWRRGPGPDDGHDAQVVEVPADPDAPDREAEVVRLTAACTALLEEAIRRNPAEWVWMHARWKTQPPPEGAAPEASAVPKIADLSSS